MPQAERYEPTGELHVFDGGEDDDAPEEEGSRLALLLVLALFVLGAFAGVVYLAYSQGVKQGRDEAPRPVVQSTQLPQKVAAAPASNSIAPETDASAGDEDTAPPPPTVISPAPKPSSNVLAPANKLAAKPATRSLAPKSHALAQNVTPKSTAPALPNLSPKSTPAARSPVAKTPPLPAKTATGRTAAAPEAAPTSIEATHALKVITPKASTTVPTKQPLAATPKQQVATTAPTATPPPAPASASAAANPAATSASPAATAAAKSSGGFVLQIGAYKSEAEAMASWRAYKSAHPAAASYAPDVRQVELPGKGTWYRLRIGSFAGPAEANALCAKLKAGGGSCFPAKR